MSATLNVNLFGPPLITWKLEPFALPRRQARALLYFLAHDLRPVPRDQVQFLLWPDEAPVKARRNLSRLLSYTRAALPHPEIVEDGGDGIGLNPGAAWSDTDHFTRHLDRDDRAALAEAVSLYRGEFLAGFSLAASAEFDAWLAGRQRYFERRYLGALARLVTVETARGNPDAAITYAHQYLAADELAEEMHRRLITLYSEIGDRAAAMRQFEQCALVLERELGVAPLPETRAAYDAARQHSAPQPVATSGAAPRWRTLPSLDLPLIGREAAWRELTVAYRRLAGGGVIFVSGEPGVGKSRLMQEFACGRDALLLVGYSGPQPLPYGCLLDALGPIVAHPALGRRVRPIWLAEAARLLPELTARIPDLPPAVAVDPLQGQARLFEALLQVLLGLAAAGPILLCFDDVHAADEATLGWLRHAAGRLAGSGLCVLATYRTQEAESLRPWQRELQRAGLAATVALRGLSAEAIAEILRRVSPQLDDPRPLAGRIRTATGGNTFFVLEVVRELMQTGRLAADVPDLPLPQSVQDAVMRRTDRLDPLARQLLEMAAVLTPLLELDTLVEAAGRSLPEVADALQALLTNQLLREQGDRFRFHHDLARETVYHHVRPWRRRLLHHRAAEALARRKAGGAAVPAAAIGRHYAAAGDAAEAVAHYHQAALVAQELFAHDEAIQYLQRAVRLLPQPADAELEATLYELLAASLHARGQFEEARRATVHALGRLPAASVFRPVRLLQRQAASFIAQHRFAEAEATLDHALELLGPDDGRRPEAWQRTWLDVQLGRMDLYYYPYGTRMPEKRAALAESVKPLLERVGEPEHHRLFREAVQRYVYHRDRFRLSPTTVENGEAMLQAAMATGRADRIANAYVTKGFCTLWSGDAAGAVGPLAAGLAVAEESGLVREEVLLRTYLAYAYRFLSDEPQTRLHARRCLRLARQLGMSTYSAAAEAHLAWLAWRAGRRDDAAARAGAAVDEWATFVQYPFRWAAYWVMLALALAGGDLARAADAARAMLDPFQQQLPDNVAGALGAALAASDSGDEQAAKSAFEDAISLARQLGYL